MTGQFQPVKRGKGVRCNWKFQKANRISKKTEGERKINWTRHSFAMKRELLSICRSAAAELTSDASEKTKHKAQSEVKLLLHLPLNKCLSLSTSVLTFWKSLRESSFTQSIYWWLILLFLLDPHFITTLWWTKLSSFNWSSLQTSFGQTCFSTAEHQRVYNVLQCNNIPWCVFFLLHFFAIL